MKHPKNTEDKVILFIFFFSLFTMWTAYTSKFCGTAQTSCRSELESAIVGFVWTVFTGIIVSAIFYAIVVKYPELKRRSMLKARALDAYDTFKYNCISIFLGTLGTSYKSDLPEKLKEPKEFQKYFKMELPIEGNRWEAICNKFDQNRRKEFQLEIEMFTEELKFIAIKLEDFSPSNVDTLRNLTLQLYWLNHTSQLNQYDIDKSMFRTFWQLFAGFDFIEGQHNEDRILNKLMAI